MNIQEHPLFLEACKKVANDWRQLAKNIRTGNEYAAHVSEETKESDFQQMLNEADEIERGEVCCFTFWQRVNYELTGECIALLPKYN